MAPIDPCETIRYLNDTPPDNASHPICRNASGAVRAADVLMRGTIFLSFKEKRMNTRFHRSLSLIFAAIVAMACSYAGAQAGPENMLVTADALLVQQIDSKHAAQGQAVMAKLRSNVKEPGQMELPKGTLLLGQVEQVEGANHDGPSKLSIVFNRARLRDGRTIPVKVTLLSAIPGSDGPYSGTGASPDLAEASIISDPDHGSVDQVPGALNVAMHSAIRDDVSAVFTRKGHNVKLAAGTQLRIAIAPEPAQSEGTANGRD
jgi:hypothetical protein